MEVGYLWTHLPDPPWASMSRTAVQSQLQPFSRLATPAWASMSAAYIRDMEVLEERLGQKQKSPLTPKTPAEKKEKQNKNKDGKKPPKNGKEE